MTKLNRKMIRLFFVANIVMVMLTANCSFSWADNTKSDINSNLDYIKSIMEMVDDKYKGDVDQDKLMQGVLKGIFNSMDSYTEFYTKDEAVEFFNTIDGEYSGVGMSFDEVNGRFFVREVYKDSPAEKAGISEGDRLIGVDGQTLEGLSSSEAVKMITGKKGTKVVISVISDGEKSVRQLTATRDEIRVNPVKASIREDVGYIKLSIFNNNSADEMKKALRKMDDNNIKKIVLDLRDNPGGDVNQVVEIAKSFIPEGLITRLDFKSENIGDMEFKSTLKEKKYKLAVLVNQNSASASEILSGAVQDAGAGTLIGTKTYGKAKVQSIYPILSLEAYKKYEEKLGVKLVMGDDLETKYGITPEESELIGWIKITTGLYYTPKGRMIDLKGIMPDYNVSGSNIINEVDMSSIGSLRLKVKPGLYSESYDVLNAKKILKISGYKIDDVSSVKLDVKTWEELKKFQKKSGLYPSGILDFSTQKALNEAYGKLELSSDKQYMKALEVLKK